MVDLFPRESPSRAWQEHDYHRSIEAGVKAARDGGPYPPGVTDEATTRSLSEDEPQIQ